VFGRRYCSEGHRTSTASSRSPTRGWHAPAPVFTRVGESVIMHNVECVSPPCITLHPTDHLRACVWWCVHIQGGAQRYLQTSAASQGLEEFFPPGLADEHAKAGTLANGCLVSLHSPSEPPPHHLVSSIHRRCCTYVQLVWPATAPNCSRPCEGSYGILP
jgi:hypothetical protein